MARHALARVAVLLMVLSAGCGAQTVSGGVRGLRPHSLQLKWTAPSGTVTSYNVYRSQTSGVYGVAMVTGLTSAAYLDKALVNGQTYYYTVTAVNSSGEGPKSAEISATVLSP